MRVECAGISVSFDKTALTIECGFNDVIKRDVINRCMCTTPNMGACYCSAFFITFQQASKACLARQINSYKLYDVIVLRHCEEEEHGKRLG